MYTLVCGLKLVEVRTYRNFHDNVGKHECSPRVRLGWTLTDFVKRSLGDEARHDLLYERTEYTRQHEDRKQRVLETRRGGVLKEERESNKERRRDSQREFSVDVRRRSPVLLKHSDGDMLDLSTNRHSVSCR